MTDNKIPRKTHTIDAAGQILGRLASKIAFLLMGKEKRTYARNIDGGDQVQVINIEAMKVTGKKLGQKEYKHYSGYPGGLKRVRLELLMSTNPKRALQLAVLRMLPKNRLRQEMIKRLQIK